jgi:hypothetical protein
MGDTGRAGRAARFTMTWASIASDQGHTIAVWMRVRALCGDLEPGVHAVRPRCIGKTDAAAQALDDTGMGLERVARCCRE